jgi:Uri superfamily endonuclease
VAGTQKTQQVFPRGLHVVLILKPHSQKDLVYLHILGFYWMAEHPTPIDLTETGIPDKRGAYALVIESETEIIIPVPRLASGNLVPGRYLYAGNARGAGGMRGRVRRHLRPSKFPHWHVDYLTRKGRITCIALFPGGDECKIISGLLTQGNVVAPIPGFGSSDCRKCVSHLLTLPRHFDPRHFFMTCFSGLQPLVLAGKSLWQY